MRSVTPKDLADSFSRWTHRFYFKRIEPVHPRDTRRALRFWLFQVYKKYTPELEEAIMRELSRRGGLKSAEARRKEKKREQQEEKKRRRETEQARQLNLFPPRRGDA